MTSTGIVTSMRRDDESPKRVTGTEFEPTERAWIEETRHLCEGVRQGQYPNYSQRWEGH